ncbi:MAG: acylphosphatase [Flavisolibacter sp.]
MTKATIKCVHLIVKGKVQGVFYRASAKDKADHFSITGWVKNTPEGNVEILACGKDDDIKEFIDWCRIGPGNAIVTDIQIHNTDHIRPNSFKILKDKF